MRTRIALGTVGLLVMGYGAWRVLGTARLTRPTTVGEWLLAALVLHDGVLAAATAAVGFVLSMVRPRARRYVVGGVVTSALVVAVAAPLIYRRGKAPRSTTLETQNYGAHLALIIAVIAAVTAGLYALRVMRDRRAQRSNDANDRPPADHTSSSS